ncbi:uncharacterized protein JN550_012368 [Neoarthrinium moseri]|uniref:uncharacterized protein n=1 Tax=Neoarthrinium moseri TaxID=1658444 RepID=UPI001FDE1C88|nr:uncharacterized protein JN550_012368 [Neoarthrinium moseri]KAI1858909.1 hypothetical protein JN550_012368 [Neoarthrinium moseri]
MRISTVGVVAYLCASVQAWEVTAYDNTASCNPDDNTRYRIINGASSLTGCMTFDQDMPGTGCREYRNGGATNGGCTTGSLIPRSLFMESGRCVAFDQPGCVGRYEDGGGNWCTFFGRDDWGPVRSFWCSGSRRMTLAVGKDTVSSLHSRWGL